MLPQERIHAMKILIVGCGRAGFSLAKDLTSDGDAELTVIERDPGAYERARESIDAMLILGDALNAETLIKAGVRNADAVVCVTSADETNILVCICAKRLGAAHTVALVRNPGYAFDMFRHWKELGVDVMVNPEHEAAREISRLLRFPTADDIDLFVGGRVELVSFKVSEEMKFFGGKSVAQIFYKKNLNVLLAMVVRADEVLIPNGDLTFSTNDVIWVIGRPSDVMDFFALAGALAEKIKNTSIIGGGSVARYLIPILTRHVRGAGIKLIEADRKKCEDFSIEFPRCLVLNADGSDEDVLSSEAVDRNGAVVCLTERDEVNAVIAMYSLQLGVRKVIVKIDQISRAMVQNLGIGSVVSPKNLLCAEIMRCLRGFSNAPGGSVRTMHRVYDNGTDRVEALEFAVTGEKKCLDRPLRELKIKKGVLIGCIVRNANILMPSGETEIVRGDVVIVIAKNGRLHDLDDVLEDA